ncbi:MAG TPA: F0F1 ATP synthase subunit delta [Geobacteraceae bacterium]|nr:F0F1 ATP synthase subunit delta [Geobacteraceae bacterium]
MKFNIWTFLFQIINFVVLLYILKRLLYKPVRNILEKRRDLIRETVENAEKTKEEALELKERHQEELRQLDEQKIRMLDDMRAEVLEEKRRLLAEAAMEADARVEKGVALFETEKAGFESRLKENAVDTVTLFSANLLRDIADEELHRALWRSFLTELAKISREIAERGIREENVTIELFSAYPLEGKDIDSLRSAMESRLSRQVTIKPTVDRTLLAGVKLRTWDMVYDSSLAGQVNEFGARLKAD